jgi:nondiscriminating glutamyl-tRNA synthetase
MSEGVRTRFAPAPTGYMHVGNVHTALFAWLFARHHGGQFVLRIEDTDELRSTPEALEHIYAGLRWLGLDWDEGPDIGGPYGPYIQSQRLEIYRQYVEQLVTAGKAYECFCTPEELEERRQLMLARGLPPRYDGRCRDLSPAEREELKRQGKPFAINFRVREVGTTVVRDLLRGAVPFDNSLMGDFVILKASGYPTYHLAVVVDDYLMRITHVIRAEEHLSNTPRHLQLQEALGFPPPAYVHLPIILGPDRTKLSKRHGAASMLEYAQMGFLPEAMFNFLALLGWSPGDEREILSREEIVQAFGLEGCSKSPAIFDLGKAEWINGEYMKLLPPEEIARRLLPYLQEAGLFEAHPTPERMAWLAAVVKLMHGRAKLLTTYVTWARYFFTDDYEYEPRAVSAWLSDPAVAEVLERLAEAYAGLESWEPGAIEGATRQLAATLGLRAAQVIHPCRAAVTGTTIGPSLFELLALLQREDVVRRLRRTAELVRTGELARRVQETHAAEKQTGAD